MRIAQAGEPVYRARARVAALAHAQGFAGEALDGILLAFTEAVNNAILYGAASVRNCVHVKMTMENHHLVLEIADHGSGFQPSNLNLPAPGEMSEGGRGLFLMHAFMDDVQWHGTPKGTTVRMVKSVRCE
jgi:anti-sigma regulatory factor (Ser/Thr protein kinase)